MIAFWRCSSVPKKIVAPNTRWNPVNDSVVMISILRKIEVVEHLRRAPKTDDSAFLENGQGRDPDGDEAVLAKRQSAPRMPDDIKSKFAIASGVS